MKHRKGSVSEMVQLREADLDDLPSLLAIYNWAVRNTTATLDVEEWTLPQRKEWFYRHGAGYPLLVAEKEGKVIGYGSLSPFHEKAGYGRTVELSVYVDEAHWREGIGKRLVEELVGRAGQLGYHSIMALITGENEASKRLHEGLGFQQAGRLKEVGYKFGRALDVYFYQRILPASDRGDSASAVNRADDDE